MLNDIKLSPGQTHASEVFLKWLGDPTVPILVLEGHSGTGKSFLAHYLLMLAQDKIRNLGTAFLDSDGYVLNFKVTATTNKAARVIGNATGQEASTIHSALGLQVENNFRTGRTVLTQKRPSSIEENTLVFVDEGSMMDLDLLYHLLDNTHNCKIVIIGDPYQLTPIFENNCPAFNQGYLTVKLTEIQRQKGDNTIIELGDRLRHTVNTKEFFDIPIDEKNIFHLDGPAFQEKITETFLEQKYPDENRILAWRNDKVNAYNKYVRGLFYNDPAPQIGETLVANTIVKSYSSSKGDIVIGNDEQVTIRSVSPYTYEGIAGYSLMIGGGHQVFLPKDHLEAKAQEKAFAKDKDWRNYFRLKENVADLRPVYASTVHKSQGSTYKNVFINLTDIGRCTNPDTVARMLYVGITRAAEKVYLYGELPPRYRGM